MVSWEQGLQAHLELSDVALQALHCQLVARLLGTPNPALLVQRCRERLNLCEPVELLASQRKLQLGL